MVLEIPKKEDWRTLKNRGERPESISSKEASGKPDVFVLNGYDSAGLDIEHQTFVCCLVR